MIKSFSFPFCCQYSINFTSFLKNSLAKGISRYSFQNILRIKLQECSSRTQHHRIVLPFCEVEFLEKIQSSILKPSLYRRCYLLKFVGNNTHLPNFTYLNNHFNFHVCLPICSSSSVCPKNDSTSCNYITKCLIKVA